MSTLREEAVEHHRVPRRQGTGVEVRTTTTAVVFVVLIATIAAVAIIGLVVKVDESAIGRAAPDPAGGGSVLLVLPIGSQPRLAAGQPVWLGADGSVRGEIVEVLPPVAADVADDQLGLTLPSQSENPAVAMARARVDDGTPTASSEVRVRLGRRSLLQLLTGDLLGAVRGFGG